MASTLRQSVPRAKPKAAPAKAAKAPPKPAPKKWSRAAEEAESTSQLGRKLRALRTERGWSLTEAQQRTGVTAGTWSRIENNKMAPTYAVLLRLMENLGIDWNQLMPVASGPPSDVLPSFSKSAKSTVVQLKTARRIQLHGQRSEGLLSPVIVEILPERSDSFELFAHEGSEFCYVLQGRLRFHSEGRKARELEVGESVLFDSRMPHAYTSSNSEPVKLLIVASSGPQLGG